MTFKPRIKRRWGADSRYYLRLTASRRFAAEAETEAANHFLESKPMTDTPDSQADQETADDLLMQDLYRAKADDMYATASNDTIEIDEQAVVSIGEDGAWVAAWVWVAERDL